MPCQEPGKREALGIGEHRLGGDQGSCKHISADSQVNLYEPVDAEKDHGAHGQFDHMAGGFLDPPYLKTLPVTAKTFVMALARDLADKRP